MSISFKPRWLLPAAMTAALAAGDDLDGGQGRDACNGGSGQDHIRNCE